MVVPKEVVAIFDHASQRKEYGGENGAVITRFVSSLAQMRISSLLRVIETLKLSLVS